MKIISLPADAPESLALYEYLDIYSEQQGFNTRKPETKPFLFVAKDGQQTLLGAIQGTVVGGWLDIYSLYVTNKSQGIGSQLLAYTENYAREQHCKGIKLVTYKFQAPKFYQKHGYNIYGQVPDLVNGYDTLFMKKLL